MEKAVGTKAVASYFLALIDAQPDLKIASVQDAAGVRPNYLWRLANEDGADLKARTIGALVRATRGHLETAMDLLLRPGATEEEGAEAARRWLKEAPQRERAQHIVETIMESAGGDIDAALAVLAELQREEKYQPGTLRFIEALLRARRDQRGGA